MIQVVALACSLFVASGQSELIDVRAVTHNILQLHFKDGHVIHHKAGQKRSDEQVVSYPLDIQRASQLSSYKISSINDSAYKLPSDPASVGRKSKGTDFAWFVDRWAGDHAENDRPDNTQEHWLYLTLPKPMQTGKTYAIDFGTLARNVASSDFHFDETSSQTEAIHVNTLGYVPSAPSKYGYLYLWMGDKGGLKVSDLVGKQFWIVDTGTKKRVFSGKVAFRKGATNPETGQLTDTPNANFLNADVDQCDFSSFTQPGTYVLSVEGMGCSVPFKLDEDVYRPAFYTTTRGLYHNRSGIALTEPYTKFGRPAPHNPLVTPGFSGQLKYTTSRYIDWKNEDNDIADKPAIEAGLKGPINVWGWYQDAGDWDSYSSHLRVAQELLLTYQMAPTHFGDGELNIPESGNGIPDIIDEAAWLPKFCYRLRKMLLEKGWGTGGIGLRVTGDHFGSDTGPKDVGQGSWQDVNRTWIVSGEDPVSTFRYAGVAAQLAHCLTLARRTDPQQIDWSLEAAQSFRWAIKNTRNGDEPKVKDQRMYAAAALFVLTGDRSYETQYIADSESLRSSTPVDPDRIFGPSVYALQGGLVVAEKQTLAKTRDAIFHTADLYLDSANRRALRWAGDWNMPMLIGQQTTPWVQSLAVAYTLAKSDKNLDLAKTYLSALYTTCDYFLGTNALNQTWVTGLGPRHPNQVFHMDSWYNGQDGPSPGIVPYGPWRKTRATGVGPWDSDWPNKSVYPNIDQWPGNERWFDNRCSPMNSEFTIHQNTAPSAAIYGFLCGEKERVRKHEKK